MASDTQYKTLIVKKFGWKRVAKNTMRFGWQMSDAEEHVTTTTETSYDGEIVGDKVYINEHVKRHTAVTVHMYFWRRKSDYKNMFAVSILELFYNIIFYIRRILGAILPFALAAIIFIYAFGGVSDELAPTISTAYMSALVIWIGAIIMEGVLSRIAGRILGVRIVKR